MPIPIFRRSSTPSSPLQDSAGGTRPTATGHPANLLQCIRAESPTPFLSILVIGSISGLSSASLLAILNIGAETAGMGVVNFRIFLMFIIGLALFFYCKRHVMNRSRILFEDVASSICQRLIDKLRHARLQDVENLGRGEIYSRITRELDRLTGFAPVIVDAAQGTVLVVFSLLYLYWLSRLTLVLMVGATIIGAAFFLLKQREITTYTEQATQKEIEVFTGLSHVLDGFKEIKLDYGKSRDLMEHITGVAEQARVLKIRSGLAGNFYFLFSQMSFYLLLGAVVFIVPRFSPTFPEVVMKSTIAILFMMGSLEHMVGVLPHIANINVAVRNIYALEAEFDHIDERNQGISLNGRRDFHDFQTIGFDNICFEYKDASGQPAFSLGPMNFQIKANDIVFIVGGNGSGKSTFGKVLTGLYLPERGVIRVDGRRVDYASYGAYRGLFGGMMDDFHLFDRLYGVTDVDLDRLHDLLRVMQLDEKTGFQEGRFTNLDLSTGQRARLALVVALMEDKPVYFLDEFAAAQDPEFRQHFYEVLLGELKATGKTMLVVSHDDRYFHIPDRILKMDYGEIVEFKG